MCDKCDRWWVVGVTRCRWPFQVAHVDRWLTVVTLKDNNVSGERDTASGVASSSTAVMRHFCSVVLSLACSNFHPPAPVLCFCSCCELTIFPLILLSESQNLQPALNDKDHSLGNWVSSVTNSNTHIHSNANTFGQNSHRISQKTYFHPQKLPPWFCKCIVQSHIGCICLPFLFCI